MKLNGERVFCLADVSDAGCQLDQSRSRLLMTASVYCTTRDFISQPLISPLSVRLLTRLFHLLHMVLTFSTVDRQRKASVRNTEFCPNRSMRRVVLVRTLAGCSSPVNDMMKPLFRWRLRCLVQQQLPQQGLSVQPPCATVTVNDQRLTKLQ